MRGYVVITDWMLALDLDIYETVIFATIYGFSQDGASSYCGTQMQIAERAKCSRRKACNIIDALVKKGLVMMSTYVDEHGTTRRSFRVTEKVLSDSGNADNGKHTTEEGMHDVHRWYAPRAQGVCTTCIGGYAPRAQFNNNINNNNNEHTTHTRTRDEEKFDFRAALISAGVEDSTASQWMEVRKKKNAVNTKIAFDRLRAEAERCCISVDEAVRTCVEESWKGFRAVYYEALQERLSSERFERSPRAARKESPLSRGMRQMQEILGMSNNDGGQTDEQ